MKRRKKYDRVILKKKEAEKLGIFPECLVAEDSGEFVTVYAVNKNYQNCEVMIEREQLLKRYQ